MCDRRNRTTPLSLGLAVLMLLLGGCGSGEGQNEGPSTPVELAVVYNPSQAGPLAERAANMTLCNCDPSKVIRVPDGMMSWLPSTPSTVADSFRPMRLRNS